MLGAEKFRSVGNFPYVSTQTNHDQIINPYGVFPYVV